MELYHNSQDPAYRHPLGAVPCDTRIRLALTVSGKPQKVILRTWNGGEHFYPMQPCGLGRWEAFIVAGHEPQILWYDFYADDERGRRMFYGNASDRLGGEGTVYLNLPPSYQITVHAPDYDTPGYLRRGIMYQIFPDRFHRSRLPETDRDDVVVQKDWYALPFPYGDGKHGSNPARDFFGGNLEGIRLKLPYLKDLGVSILYLNPIFKARHNHRYDTGDYKSIDPILGTEDDFKRLCKEAGDLGIRVMLDGVFSHTGDDSIYFNRYGRYPGKGAYQSKHSPYYPWYRFTEYPDKYACWWNIDTLPEVNKDIPGYREFILGERGVVRNWIGKGACGWRLDVADELPMSFLREMRKSARIQDPDAALLGEVWEDASNKMAYGRMRSYCLGDTLDSVMNYPLRDVLIRFFTHDCDAEHLVRLIRSLQENYPKVFFYSLMNLMGSHDRVRILNLLAKQEYANMPPQERGKQVLAPDLKALATERFKNMLRLVAALPGMPSLYYGDEAGMEGANDPYNRGPFPWGLEDRDLTAFVKETFRQRNDHPVLQTGTFDIAYEGKHTVLIYRGLDERGRDAFGDEIKDRPCLIRVTRDTVQL